MISPRSGDPDLQARQPLLGAWALAGAGGDRAAVAGGRLAGLAEPLVDRAERQQRIDPLIAQLGAPLLDIGRVAEERAVVHVVAAVEPDRLGQAFARRLRLA